jgi:ABC-type lipoprotein release transport system permease subunit
MKIDLQMAWRNVWRNPRRTWLTVGAIAFACLVLVFMLSFQLGSYATMIDSSVKIEVGHLQVQAKGFHDDHEMRQVVEDPAAVDRLLDGIPQVAAYTSRADAFAVLSSEERTYAGQVVGIDPEREVKVSSLESLVREGSFLSADDPEGALVGDLLADNLKIGLGDEVTVIGQGRDGSVAATVLTVRGIFSSGIDELDRTTVEMPLATFQQVFSMGDAVHQVVVTGTDLWSVPAIQKQLVAGLGGPAGIDQSPPLVVLDWNQLMPGLLQSIKVDLVSGLIFYVALIFVVAFSILNTFLMAFLERTREFGVMMAIGTPPGRLGRLLLLESLALTGVGIAVGIVLGCAVTLYFQAHGIDVSGANELLERFGISGRMYPQLSVVSALVGPLLVLVITGLAALYPALKIRRLKPVEAMRHA